MRIPQSRDQKVKAAVHATQGVLVAITGILAIAVLTEAGEVSGQVGYVLALSFFSIAALIYQVMVPMWTRAWRFANVYAYAAIDLLFTVFWFAAFIAVAMWESEGVSKGKSSGDNKSGTCSNFAYGSVTKCQTSRAIVAFGVLLFLLFAATAAMSLRAVFHYRRTGIVPNAVHLGRARDDEMDPSKDAWSTDTNEIDYGYDSSHGTQHEYEPLGLHGQRPRDDYQQSLLNPSRTSSPTG